MDGFVNKMNIDKKGMSIQYGLTSSLFLGAFAKKIKYVKFAK